MAADVRTYCSVQQNLKQVFFLDSVSVLFWDVIAPRTTLITASGQSTNRRLVR